MVKRIFFILYAVLPLNVAVASHTALRTIEEIKINETGKSDDKSINVIDGCRAFKITEEEVREYFSKSYPVPLNFNIHERYSPCYATGFIEFSDNTRGKWKISSSGGATLLWDTGDVVTLFYNDYKWTDPFAGTYTSEDESD